MSSLGLHQSLHAGIRKEKQSCTLYLGIGDIRDTIDNFSHSSILTAIHARLCEIFASMTFSIRNMIKIKFDEAEKYRILEPARTEKSDAGGIR